MPTSKRQAGGGSQGGFLIGDSIGAGLQSTGALSGFQFDATAGISLATTLSHGIPGSDASQIRNAGSIVVELGTNLDPTPAVFQANAHKMIQGIQKINSGASIFWVEIFSQGGSSGYPNLVSKYDAYNKILASLPGITVIPTKNLSIPLADSIHPTPGGYQTLGNAISQTVGSGGGTTTGGGGGTPTPAPGGSGSLDPGVAKTASFSTFLDLPGILDQQESLALTGQRSLMNDQPLLPFVEQLAQASLRNFMSMPNGNFYAFFPDYFGGLDHRTPYWEISDIEIIDGQIQLSDDALATHVYIVGDTAGYFDGINWIDKVETAGVVTVFNAFMADFLNGVNSPVLEKQSKDKKKVKANQAEYEKRIESIPTLADKGKALAFLQKYGARPLYQEMPMVRSPYYELFLAYQTFCLFWAKQFLTRFEFTFMPELYPGGIVAFPEHGIQCYIDEVTHEGDYTNGFTTQANLSAPAALRDSQGNTVGNRPWVNEGMIRAGIFTAAGPTSSGSKGHHK